MKISAENFKKQYLYFEKEYINKNICCYFGKYDKQVKESLKHIFPYITDKDTEIFLKYINYSNIEYSNRLNLKLDKLLFTDYLNTLEDDKIIIDVMRLIFTKKFIAKCGGKLRKIDKVRTIDTKDLIFLKEDDIYLYNFNQITNKDKFLNNILLQEPFFKYLLHQDIHNSILNPILVSIMLFKYYENEKKLNTKDNNSTIIQLRDIKQIYTNVDKMKSKIEMIYFVKKFFILNTNISEIPIEQKIYPYLIIKCDMHITNDNVLINLTY